MPRRRTLSIYTERYRRQQAALKEEPSHRQRRLEALRRYTQNVRLQQRTSATQQPTTAEPQPATSAAVAQPSTSTAAPHPPTEQQQDSLFQEELLEGSPSICCLKDKVKLPQELVCDKVKNLITVNDARTQNYLDRVQNYNNVLAFASDAITINKAQGKTLQSERVFTHDQLYVMYSRVRSFQNIFVNVKENAKQVSTEDSIITSNVMYKEAL